MKTTFISAACLAIMATSLAACGSDEKTTVIHERPTVVTPVVNQNGTSPSTVESECAHGYDNTTHSCY